MIDRHRWYKNVPGDPKKIGSIEGKERYFDSMFTTVHCQRNRRNKTGWVSMEEKKKAPEN
jgi:hypothetical protein